jgi:tricarballylate dehydrogenase
MIMGNEQAKEYDVLVIGGGNAALCAAITAREQKASVLLLECAPKHFRGGNSRHTRNMRLAHETHLEPYTGAYPAEEMWNDYMKATGGIGNLELAKMVINGSANILDWMKSHGVRFQPALVGTLHLGRTNAWFLGGGKTMVNALYRNAEKLGVQIRYNAEVIGLDIQNGYFQSASVLMDNEIIENISAKTVVVAAGGFQSNPEWLRKAWGHAAENFLIRGTPYDTGRLLRILLDLGVEPIGDPTQAHMVPIDARSPKYDGGIVTRLDCVTLGVVVNNHGERFYDEGEDFWPMRYAIWGRLIAKQADQIAYVFIDSKTLDRFMPSVFPPIKGHSIPEVADQFDLPVDKVEATVNAYNKAVQPGNFDHTILDDCKTNGLTPPKTHWALRIDDPPFYGYPLRPGLTFTYFGVTVNKRAKVMMADGKPARNIFAAGEIMAGNVLPKGYIGGIGLVIGNIYGRAAGFEAASLAKKKAEN